MHWLTTSIDAPTRRITGHCHPSSPCDVRHPPGAATMAMDDAQRHPRQICKVRMPLSRYYPDVHRLALFSLANTDICITRYLDAIMEQKNDRQKERAVGHSLMNALHFTPVQPAMQHVRQAFRATEFGDEKDDTGVRSSLRSQRGESHCQDVLRANRYRCTSNTQCGLSSVALAWQSVSLLHMHR